MEHPYSRKLDNLDLIEHFLSVVLNHKDSNNNHLLNKIKSGEAELKNYGKDSATLNYTNHRHREYVDENKRWKLRSQIVQELIELEREDEDDNIHLTKGGALPHNALKKEKQAFIVIGLPASGKSTIASKIADHYGAIILDSDFAKRKLPEFKENPAGASLVHDESDALIFGYFGNDKPDNFKSLIEICSFEGINIVIPKIGHNAKSINKLAKNLNEIFGYTIHLTLVSLDRKLAANRAVNRFIDSDRYVPLSLIFDGYGNDPTLTYYRLKNNYFDDKTFIDTYGKISTEVELGEPYKLVYSDEFNPANIFT